MKTLTIPFASDPAHGWALVHRSMIHNLGIEEQISAYSYQKGDLVALEEDCDASLLVNAVRDRFGKEVEFVEDRELTDLYNYSVIRNWQGYRA